MVAKGLVEGDRSTVVRPDVRGVSEPKEERDDRVGTASDVIRRGGGGGRRGPGDRLYRFASIRDEDESSRL